MRGTYRQGIAVGRKLQVVAESTARPRVAGLHIGLLAPGSRRARKDIGRAGKDGRVVRLVAVDAGCDAAFTVRAHGQRAAVRRQRDAGAEKVAAIGVAGFHIGLLAPARPRARENVDRARGASVVVLVAVDARGMALLLVRSDRERAAVGGQRHRTPEVIGRIGVAGLEIPDGLVDTGRDGRGGCAATAAVASLHGVLGIQARVQQAADGMCVRVGAQVATNLRTGHGARAVRVFEQLVAHRAAAYRRGDCAPGQDEALDTVGHHQAGGDGRNWYRWHHHHNCRAADLDVAHIRVGCAAAARDAAGLVGALVKDAHAVASALQHGLCEAEGAVGVHGDRVTVAGIADGHDAHVAADRAAQLEAGSRTDDRDPTRGGYGASLSCGCRLHGDGVGADHRFGELEAAVGVDCRLLNTVLRVELQHHGLSGAQAGDGAAHHLRLRRDGVVRAVDADVVDIRVGGSGAIADRAGLPRRLCLHAQAVGRACGHAQAVAAVGAQAGSRPARIGDHHTLARPQAGEHAADVDLRYRGRVTIASPAARGKKDRNSGAK